MSVAYRCDVCGNAAMPWSGVRLDKVVKFSWGEERGVSVTLLARDNHVCEPCLKDAVRGWVNSSVKSTDIRKAS